MSFLFSATVDRKKLEVAVLFKTHHCPHSLSEDWQSQRTLGHLLSYSGLRKGKSPPVRGTSVAVRFIKVKKGTSVPCLLQI